MIPQKMVYHLQEVFEELCVQILLPVLPEQISMNITAEYSEEDAAIQMKVLYNGGPFDPEDCGNEPALALVKYASEQFAYLGYSQTEGMNTVRLTIGE